MIKEKIKYRNIFYLVSAAGITAFFITAIFFNDNVRIFDFVALGHADNMALSDYLRHVFFANDLSTTYDKGWDACFPPLAYLYFHFIWKINPIFEEDPGMYGNYFGEPYEVLLTIMFLLFFALITYFAINRLLKRSTGESLLLTLLLMFSMPFMFATFQRANPVFLVFALLLLALGFKDSDSRFLREMALILIAVSASFKIYPAIFGLLYVKENRWKEAVRLMIYGILLFFVPFIWVGGWHDFLIFITYLTDRGTKASYSWTSVRGVIMYFMQDTGLSEHQIKLIGFACENIFFVCSVALAFLSRRQWKAIFFFTTLMTCYVVTNFIYTLDYVAIAAVLFAAQSDEEELAYPVQKWLNGLYAILFGLIFSLPVWGLFLNIEAEHCVYGPLYIMFIIAGIEETVLFIKRRREK